IGALPGRKPGTRAFRAKSRAICRISASTTSCGISISRFFLHSLRSISSAFMRGKILKNWKFAIAANSDQCERVDKNAHGVSHWILGRAGLPVPPLSRVNLIVRSGEPRVNPLMLHAIALALRPLDAARYRVGAAPPLMLHAIALGVRGFLFQSIK